MFDIFPLQCAGLLVESLRTNKYLYTDLEEMYLGIVKHGQDPQMMIKELSDTLNLQRYGTIILLSSGSNILLN